jgi:hypothetical protein
VDFSVGSEPELYQRTDPRLVLGIGSEILVSL